MALELQDMTLTHSPGLPTSVLLTDVMDLLFWPLFVLVLLVLQIVLLQVELPGQESRLLVLLQFVLCRQDRVSKDLRSHPGLPGKGPSPHIQIQGATSLCQVREKPRSMRHQCIY